MSLGCVDGGWLLETGTYRNVPATRVIIRSFRCTAAFKVKNMYTAAMITMINIPMIQDNKNINAIFSPLDHPTRGW